MKNLLFSTFILFLATFSAKAQTPPPTRMKEVFSATILNSANINSGWEIAYLPGDDSLWITEDTSYRILKMHPGNGGFRVLTDLSDGSTAGQLMGLPLSYRRTFVWNTNPWPQGGMMGLAFHPEFMSNAAKRWVYLQYVHTRTSSLVFISRLVRLSYNATTGQFENPVILCDTIPGSSDHNSGRLIVAPVGGTNYLFLSVGDMGAGQFGNTGRTIKSQNSQSYEGKILRFNLEEDADADQGTVDYDKFIPNDNPYNNVAPVTGQSAVYSIGHRNVQGFALFNGKLYGSSHGQFSDDELNILEPNKNYGHPRIQGYADGNYNGTRAALTHNPYIAPTVMNPNPTQTGTATTLPAIVDEAADALTIPNYTDPIYSFYAAPNLPLSPPVPAAPLRSSSIKNIFTYNPGNIEWPSIAPSGMDVYTNSKIPGWKNSLMLASLKDGSVIRVKLNSDGSDVETGGIGGFDTSYVFVTSNRFRDLAIDPDGLSFYTSIDRRGSTSGPTDVTPVFSACRGCIIKYTFLGYNPTVTSPFPSTIPTSIPVELGTANSCVSGNTVTINATNNNIWVPITGPDGNIIAEIDANGNNLGTVTTSFYTRTGNPVRSAAGNNKYLNRNITISVQNQPSSNVNIRLYITGTELADMVATVGSGVTVIGDLGIFKNNDGCGATISATPTGQTITGRYTQSSYGHAIQASIGSFSTFYFLSTNSTLPVDRIAFTGKGQNGAAFLKWVVENEDKVALYEVERSLNNSDFEVIGKATVKGNGLTTTYNYTDLNASKIAASVYYRIKIIDQDGSFKYSSIINIGFANFNEPKLSVYPNPAKEKVQVVINADTDETAQFRIVDNTGRTVSQRMIIINKGRNNFEVNTSALPTGVYYIDITGKTITQKIKLIKQ